MTGILNILSEGDRFNDEQALGIKGGLDMLANTNDAFVSCSCSGNGNNNNSAIVSCSCNDDKDNGEGDEDESKP